MTALALPALQELSLGGYMDDGAGLVIAVGLLIESGAASLATLVAVGAHLHRARGWAAALLSLPAALGAFLVEWLLITVLADVLGVAALLVGLVPVVALLIAAGRALRTKRPPQPLAEDVPVLRGPNE